MGGLEKIAEGNGLMLMVVGMSVVFFALVTLLFSMKLLKRSEQLRHFTATKRGGTPEDLLAIIGPDGSSDIPGVTVAAIAMTLILEEESVHDEESLVLTLQAIKKPYSNWWQDRIERFWPVRLSGGQQSVWRTKDPEQGRQV